MAFCTKRSRSTTLTKQKCFTLVSNGTAALVFKCIGRNGVNAALTSLTDEEGLKTEFSEYWDQFLQNPENEDAIFYVKVATSAIDGRGSRSSSINYFQYMTNDDDFSRTYPVKSLFNHKCEIILMADRGNLIDENTAWTPEQFHQMFQQLQTKTLALTKKAYLHHGDIARHNVLLGTDLNGVDQLVLIDWDEARTQIKPRECGNDPYMKLCHPEVLRRDQRDLYTNAQLSLILAIKEGACCGLV